MSTSEKIEFKITLDGTYHDDPPKYEVLLDQEVISYGEVSQTQDDPLVVQFSRDLPEGEHHIKIRLLGKKPRHTVQDSTDAIIKDQLLNIREIEIDEIELGQLFYSLGEFYRQNSIIKGIPVFNDQAETQKYVNLGWNGEYRLRFSVPTYMWFLENF
jgi:hypothetical protein